LRRARALAKLKRPVEAMRLYRTVGREAVRRMDRARALYEMARLIEGLERVDAAISVYRRLVATYPELMPGATGLKRLRRLQQARGPAGVDAHLGWTRLMYPRLRHTALGDNLPYYAAQVAHRRWLEREDMTLAEDAEYLYEEVIANHEHDGLWKDALWHLSYVYEGQAQWDKAIETIRRIQKTRERSVFVGHYDHRYYWVGQFRIAKIQRDILKKPVEAMASYDWFLDHYPDSRYRDDAMYWKACAALEAEQPGVAGALFETLLTTYPESKYRRRIATVTDTPGSSLCAADAFPMDPL